MRRAVPTWTVLLAAAAAASACEQGDGERVAIRLVLADTAACRPTSAVTAVRFEALGHFAATTPGAVVTLAPGDALATSEFPAATRAFSVEATSPSWLGAGVALRADTDDSIDVLLLPYGAACAAVDPELRVPDGAAWTGLDDGSLLVAGGSDGGQAQRRVVVRAPGQRFAEVLEGLAERREGASATVLGARVLLAGGGLGDSGPALDSYEVYDHGAGAMDRDAAGYLTTPRRDHGAARLPDGRALLVGGLGEAGGAPLDSAEIVDLATGASAPTGPLPSGRRAPEVVALDDGTTLVLGGYSDASDTCATEVLVFDAVAGAFTVAPDVALPPYPRARAVPLPGARVAYVGEAGGAPSSAAVQLLRVDPASGVVHEVVDLGGELPELVAVEAAAMPDGKLLIAGEDAGGDPRAFLVDLGLARVAELPSLGTPTALGVLADALVVALDATSALFLRETIATRYDHPPSTLVEDELAFDAPSRWSDSGPVRFTATAEGARFDVAPFAFLDFAVDAVRVETGAAELLLVPAPGGEVAVRVEPDAAAIGDCAVSRSPDAPLALERRGSTITIEAGLDARSCHVDGLEGEVHLAVRASAGAVVRAPSIRRL